MNQFSFLWERIWNDSQDDLSAAVTTMHGQGSTPRSVLIRKEDFASALKTVCPAEDQAWMMWALVYNTDDECWVVSQLRTQPFDALGGVYAWWRCGRAIMSALARLFSLVVFFYVDDVFMAEFEPLADHAKQVFQELVAKMGWELAVEKF